MKHTCLSLPFFLLSLFFLSPLQKTSSFSNTGQKTNEERGDVLRYSITKQTCFRTLTTARRNAMGSPNTQQRREHYLCLPVSLQAICGIALMQQHQQSILRGEMDKILTSADAMRRIPSSSSTTTSTPSTSSKNEDESMAKYGENIYTGAFSQP